MQLGILATRGHRSTASFRAAACRPAAAARKSNSTHLCCCCSCCYAAATLLWRLLAHGHCFAAGGPGSSGAPAAEGGGALVRAAGDRWGQCRRCARQCCHAAGLWEGGPKCPGPGRGRDDAQAVVGAGMDPLLCPSKCNDPG